MPHRLYQTDGLVLARHYYGEANALYQILTPDLGLVGATAQGVRWSRSKLRAHLEPLSAARLTLVRGREVWRLTGANNSGLLAPLLADRDKRRAWARIAGLLRRLIRGERSDAALFTDLQAGLGSLCDWANSAEAVATAEAIIVLRLLQRLGYVSAESALTSYLRADWWSQPDWPLAYANQTPILAAINHGLHHSQL